MHSKLEQLLRMGYSVRFYPNNTNHVGKYIALLVKGNSNVLKQYGDDTDLLIRRMHQEAKEREE